MKNKAQFFLFLFILLSLTFLSFSKLAFAQPAIDIPTTYTIIDEDAVNGDILSFTNGGITRANAPYTNQIFGVLQDNPIIVYRTNEKTGDPIMRSGTAEVNVTNITGDIKVGDYVTSSPIPGKGQKAAESGYILGVALADFSSDGQTISFGGQEHQTGVIPVALKIEYAEITNARSFNRLFDYFNQFAFESVQSPERASQFFRFIIAAIISLGSIIFSFFVFARSITKSIEAIGRNPLAKTAIQASIIINAGLTILTIILGLAAAYLIIRA